MGYNKISSIKGSKVTLPPETLAFVKSRGAAMLKIARDSAMTSMERLGAICIHYDDSISLLRHSIASQDGRAYPILNLYRAAKGIEFAPVPLGNIEAYNLAAIHLHMSFTLASYEANMVKWKPHFNAAGDGI